jgi:hypothetical protein
MNLESPVSLLHLADTFVEQSPNQDATESDETSLTEFEPRSKLTLTSKIRPLALLAVQLEYQVTSVSS